MKYITTLVDLEQLKDNSSFYVAGNAKYSVKLPAYFDVDVVEKYDDLFISINKIFHENELEDFDIPHLKNNDILFFSSK